MRTSGRLLVGMRALTLLVCPVAHSQDSNAAQEASFFTGWTFEVAPYLWLPALDGTVTVRGLSAGVDQSVGDTIDVLFDSLKFAALGLVEDRRGDLLLTLDFLYLDLGENVQTDVGAGVNVRAKQLILEFGGGYHLGDWPLTGAGLPTVSVDVLAGGRFVDLDTVLRSKTSLTLTEVRPGSTHSWGHGSKWTSSTGCGSWCVGISAASAWARTSPGIWPPSWRSRCRSGLLLEQGIAFRTSISQRGRAQRNLRTTCKCGGPCWASPSAFRRGIESGHNSRASIRLSSPGFGSSPDSDPQGSSEESGSAAVPLQRMEVHIPYAHRVMLTAFALALGVALGSPAGAQEVLPAPPAPFKGQIGLSAKDSQADFPQPVQAPKGAPNIIFVLLDDVGFGASSTFGGPIETPTLDRLAKNGLRCTQFHTTALCSPTRAALLTGRNHHSTHTGVVMELGTGFPGYDTPMGKDTATVAEALKQKGWNTAWFGKNHNVPAWLLCQPGPFDLWPMGLRFEQFYGLAGGETNQWRPAVFEGTKPIAPYLGNPDYNFDYGMAHQPIKWVRNQKAVAPDRPFFILFFREAYNGTSMAVIAPWGETPTASPLAVSTSVPPHGPPTRRR